MSALSPLSDHLAVLAGEKIAPLDSRGGWQETALDVRQIPTELDLSPSKIGPWVLLFGGPVFFLIGLIELISSGDTAWYLAVGFAAFGSFATYTGYIAANTYVTALFGTESVRVKYQSPRKIEEWTAFYKQFHGLQHRRHKFKPNGSGSRKFHIVELVHSTSSRTLPIFVTEGEWLYDDWLERYQGFFGLPLLRSDFD